MENFHYFFFKSFYCHSNLPDPLINISENFSILSLHLQRQIYKDNSATDNSHPYYSFPSFLIIVLELFRWNIFSLTPRLAISIQSTNTQTCFTTYIHKISHRKKELKNFHLFLSLSRVFVKMIDTHTFHNTCIYC